MFPHRKKIDKQLKKKDLATKCETIETEGLKLLAVYYATTFTYCREWLRQWAALSTNRSLINIPPHPKFSSSAQPSSAYREFTWGISSINGYRYWNVTICGNSRLWASSPPIITGCVLLAQFDSFDLVGGSPIPVPIYLTVHASSLYSRHSIFEINVIMCSLLMDLKKKFNRMILSRW